MVMVVTSALIHTNIPPKKYGEERVIMKITGVLVYMLVELDSDTYRKHVAFENGNKLIYVVVLRVIYGMLVEDLLFYKKFRGDLKNIRFQFNPYDPCFANRIKSDKQNKVIFHVGDIIYSHGNPKVNYKFKELMNCNYGNHGEVGSNREKVHNYLGINFDSTEKSKVEIKIDECVEVIINYFPMEIISSNMDLTPAGDNLFEKGNRKSMGKK